MNYYHNQFQKKCIITLTTVFIFLCLNSCNKKEEHGGDTSTASSCSSESLLINEVSGAHIIIQCPGSKFTITVAVVRLCLIFQ